MKSRVADMRSLPAAGAPGVAPAALRKAAFLREVVVAASAHPGPRAFSSEVRCILRMARQDCGSRIQVITSGDVIRWWCDGCGEEGEIIGFGAVRAEVPSEAADANKGKCLWGFDEECRAVLFAATAKRPTLRAVVARAAPAPGIPELLSLEATAEELDEMCTLVEALATRARSARKVELLTALRFSLSSAIDGL